ncbi:MULTISPECIES: helix-turn-helix domain-containing protein [unclassified Chryseobacterium]|uniref:helix-turn-helix domain-containing protein n=1 Tax=unclassified Chryseobacterium TaxID=2593645 RepID=UPI000D39B3A4|nr:MULTISPECIES: helix-turn-helix domain-containing protein [unclassified Chryseobacterium]PTT76534.1 DNA-binding protein [Chryseobacterium sp. HMWF001]PVV55581.1 DNA-binding protein [Chryseobacterium sp. HMWF035]
MNIHDHQKDKELFLIQTDSETFYKMVKKIVERIKSEEIKDKETDFISEKEAMQLLGISSKSTLQKYRDQSVITFYKLSGRKIRYSRLSIEKFIHSKKESFD